MSAVSIIKNKAVSDFEFGKKLLNDEELAEYLKEYNIPLTHKLSKLYSDTYDEQVEMACEFASLYADLLEGCY